MEIIYFDLCAHSKLKISILFHLISSHLISSRLVSSRLVSSRLVSSRLVSSRLVSSHLISFHFLYYSVPFRSILFHPIPFHSVSVHSVPFHSVPIYYLNDVQVRPPTGKIKSIHCSCDGTFLLTSQGRVLAFGNNEYNNMALNLPPRLKKRSVDVSDDHYVLPELYAFRKLVNGQIMDPYFSPQKIKSNLKIKTIVHSREKKKV